MDHITILQDLKTRITGPDGHLLDRNTIAAELDKALAAEALAAEALASEVNKPLQDLLVDHTAEILAMDPHEQLSFVKAYATERGLNKAADWIISMQGKTCSIAANDKNTSATLIEKLENIMRPAGNYCEIYLAGMRHGYNSDATAYQVESQPQVFKTVNAPTLKEAIELAVAQNNQEAK